ncbi:OsmC family protein [Flavihumibacter fluvii]|uniref:OsmC family protein n=1 Tax=Flavihumibacter fluvii TaxID=2838157 RepID=UPI001BDE4097|nr:OsmC family protein [Flavihumibacter fluvii]ULQ51317.1 OsmC family protein [Flavihumibacter fluvii]
MIYTSIVKERQQPLNENYILDPQAAWITDVAVIEGKNLSDPFHTSVCINDELKVDFPVGVHRAVGGHHDFPNSGDLLCAAMASCFETALRMIANRLQIALYKTTIRATANVDVRGTLRVDKNVPVCFQTMGLEVEITINNSVKEETANKLISATEQSCIVLQTLTKGIPVLVDVKILYCDNTSI